MTNSHWKFEPTGHVPLFDMTCPVCSHTMHLRWSTVFKPKDVLEALRHSEKAQSLPANLLVEIQRRNGWAEDQEYKCPRCQHVKLFGIPLSGEEIEEVRKVRDRATVIPLAKWLEDELIKGKLMTLGYW